MGPEGDQGPAGPAGAAGTAKIADGSVTLAKLADATAINQIIVADGTKRPAWVTMSGDVTIVAGGATTIGAGKVTSAKILDLTIATGDIADSAVTSAKIAVDTIVAADIATGAVATAEILNATILEEDLANNAVTLVKMADNSVGSAEIVDGSVNSVDITNDAILNADINPNALIAWAKMATLTSAWILVGNASNVATAVNPGGDVEIDNAGVTTIQPSVVTSAKIADGTITSADIANDTIVDADVNSSAAIAWSKMAALPSTQILVGSLTGVATVVTMTGDVTISNLGVTTLQNNTVTSAKIVDSTITADDIAAGAVDSSEIATDAVGSAEIAAGAVDTSELANDAVTKAKLGYTVVAIIVNAGGFAGQSAADPALIGGQILGYYPTGNQDQFVDSVALDGTGVVTVNLATNAVNNNTFNVVVLWP
jgi:hypothetical protein